ncbi:MAG: cell division ATP-binding protein FtsE [Clostridia bacterium]|nr:cell division ATP-binding protein FtsE [Clostridia bacterium]
MIHLKDVSKVYPNGTVALKNISLDIGQGEFVFIVGNSGAGKSTFLKLLIHEESATSGEIVVNGHNLMKIKKRRVPYLRRTMGIVFQDFRLIDKMNVYDNIAFAMRAIGTPEKAIKKRVQYVLGLVGLENKEKHRPNELSGGEQQRVSLARALVNNPEMIIADEPTGNIDPKLSHDIINLLSEINKRGTTVIIVTHEHDLVREFGGRVINITDGEVIEDKKITTKYHPDDDSTYSLPETTTNENADADTEENKTDDTAEKEENNE